MICFCLQNWYHSNWNWHLLKCLVKFSLTSRYSAFFFLLGQVPQHLWCGAVNATLPSKAYFFKICSVYCILQVWNPFQYLSMALTWSLSNPFFSSEEPILYQHIRWHESIVLIHDGTSRQFFTIHDLTMWDLIAYCLCIAFLSRSILETYMVRISVRRIVKTFLLLNALVAVLKRG